jgi:hypothetical protein
MGRAKPRRGNEAAPHRGPAQALDEEDGLSRRGVVEPGARVASLDRPQARAGRVHAHAARAGRERGLDPLELDARERSVEVGDREARVRSSNLVVQQPRVDGAEAPGGDEAPPRLRRSSALTPERLDEPRRLRPQNATERTAVLR